MTKSLRSRIESAKLNPRTKVAFERKITLKRRPRMSIGAMPLRGI